MKLGCLSSQAWAALGNLLGPSLGIVKRREGLLTALVLAVPNLHQCWVYLLPNNPPPPPPSAKCAPTLRNRWRAGLDWAGCIF